MAPRREVDVLRPASRSSTRNGRVVELAVAAAAAVFGTGTVRRCQRHRPGETVSRPLGAPIRMIGTPQLHSRDGLTRRLEWLKHRRSQVRLPLHIVDEADAGLRDRLLGDRDRDEVVRLRGLEQLHPCARAVLEEIDAEGAGERLRVLLAHLDVDPCTPRRRDVGLALGARSGRVGLARAGSTIAVVRPSVTRRVHLDVELRPGRRPRC